MQYDYQNKQHFLSVLDSKIGLFVANPRSRSDYIIFTGVDEETITRDAIDFETFSSTHQLILVKMESVAHACAHRVLNDILRERLKNMGIAERCFIPYGSAHVQGREGKKRADESYKPWYLPRNRSKRWPCMVVEVRYSGGHQKLKLDVDWWIKESTGDVQSVITIGINRNIKQMTICLWHPDNTNIPHQSYRNVLSEDGRGTVKTTNPGPLVIEFERLLLRSPSGMEKDVTITIPDLKDLAQIVWKSQFEEVDYLD